MARGKHLIVFTGNVIIIRAAILGTDLVAEITLVGHISGEFIGKRHFRFKVNQLTHFLPQSLVEIDQKLPPLFIERAEIVLVVFKERSCSIGTDQCVPM